MARVEDGHFWTTAKWEKSCWTFGSGGKWEGNFCGTFLSLEVLSRCPPPFFWGWSTKIQSPNGPNLYLLKQKVKLSKKRYPTESWQFFLVKMNNHLMVNRRVANSQLYCFYCQHIQGDSLLQCQPTNLYKPLRFLYRRTLIKPWHACRCPSV